MHPTLELDKCMIITDLWKLLILRDAAVDVELTVLSLVTTT